jgi:hypothetical protein
MSDAMIFLSVIAAVFVLFMLLPDKRGGGG